jgi:Cu(I)/Ag(I) efflux system periplasmic protein CusF
MKAVLGLLALSGALLTVPLAAQTSNDHAAHHPDAKAATAAPMSDGEVRKIDKSAGKITIKHGQLQSLDMPPMTMVFRVKDPAMLDQVKEGDKIRFSADRIDGALTVTEIQPGK